MKLLLVCTKLDVSIRISETKFTLMYGARKPGYFKLRKYRSFRALCIIMWMTSELEVETSVLNGFTQLKSRETLINNIHRETFKYMINKTL